MPVHTQSSYTKEELVACGHGKLFGPGNAQLPKDNMLMIDRITHICADDGEHGKGSIVAELDINPEGRALGAGEVKFTGQVLPNVKSVVYRLDLKRVIERMNSPEPA